MKINKDGFFQAFGVFVYCTLIGLFMGNANSLFGDLGLPFGPILILLLFSTSALVCAAIVFYKPYKVFVDGKKKEALDIVISTAVWLAIFLLFFFIALFIFK